MGILVNIQSDMSQTDPGIGVNLFSQIPLIGLGPVLGPVLGLVLAAD